MRRRARLPSRVLAAGERVLGPKHPRVSVSSSMTKASSIDLVHSAQFELLG